MVVISYFYNFDYIFVLKLKIFYSKTEVPVDIEKDIQELDQNTFPKVTEAVHNGSKFIFL